MLYNDTTDLDHLLRPLELLLRQNISPEQFYQQYLHTLLVSLPGKPLGAHLWMLQGQDFVSIGGSDRSAILYDTDLIQREYLHEQIQESVALKKTLLLPALEHGNLSSCVLAITPMFLRSTDVQGAQVCWWQSPGDGLNDPLRQSVRILDTLAPVCAQMMRIQKIEATSNLTEQLQQMMHFLTDIMSSSDLSSLAVTIVNRAKEISQCDRSALVAVGNNGSLRLLAISNVPTPNERSAVSRTLLQLGENSRTNGLPALYQKKDEKTSERGDLSDYFYHSNMAETMILPIQQINQSLCGMLYFESERTEFFNQGRQQTALGIVSQTVAPLSTALRAEQRPLRWLSDRLHSWRMLTRKERRRILLHKVWIPILILLVIAAIPFPFEFSGDARLMPIKRAIAVSEVDGRISKVLHLDGDRVSSGETLVELDDSEQRKLCEISTEEVERARAEADQLMASNDPVGTQISKLQYERALRQLQQQQYNLQQTQIKAPISGVIMAPDLSSREGDAVLRGGQIALIGDPAAWELEIWLSESDVAPLVQRLHGGKPASIHYILNALPDRHFNATLTDEFALSPSSTVVGGKNLFRLVIPLPVDSSQSDFRAGYTGRARIEIGYRPLGVMMTRHFINWIRIHVLF